MSGHSKWHSIRHLNLPEVAGKAPLLNERASSWGNIVKPTIPTATRTSENLNLSRFLGVAPSQYPIFKSVQPIF